jgi:hypothetical protein
MSDWLDRELVRDGRGVLKMVEDRMKANDNSAWPCGCDPGCRYTCQWHTKEELMNEVRVVDPTTGGEKGSKEERFDLIPNEFERALALHYGKGARKYADRNWERGYKWSLSVAALRRHLSAWLDGESLDAETGSSHLIAVAWHACALFIFELRGLGTDDIRRKPAVTAGEFDIQGRSTKEER